MGFINPETYKLLGAYNEEREKHIIIDVIDRYRGNSAHCYELYI